MNNLRIAILQGGPGAKYSQSLETGSEITSLLADICQYVKIINITKRGEWLEDGKAKSPNTILADIDMVFLNLTKEYGRSGLVQKILHKNNIPFNGSRALNIGIASRNKLINTNDILKLNSFDFKVNNKAPDNISLELEEKLNGISSENYTIKSYADNTLNSIGLISKNDLLNGYIDTLPPEIDLLTIEENITGKKVSSALIENFRNHEYYVFPLAEIQHNAENKGYIDYEDLINEADLHCPAQLTFSEREKINTATSNLHTELGLSQYSHFNFILDGDNLHLLDVDTLPEISKNSIYTKIAESAGLNQKELLRHLLDTASA